MDLTQYFIFAVCWIGIMALIGGALWLTQKFRKKDEETTVDPKAYAESFEEEQNALTPEKPIKKHFRNPFYLSPDEIKETKEQTDINRNG